MGRKNKSRQTGSVVPPQLASIQHSALEKGLASARHHISSRNPVLAVKAYRGLLADYPKNAEIYFELGGVYWQLGLLADAETVYRSALKLRPMHADAQCNLGIIVWRQYGVSEAIPYFQKALKADPKHIGAMYNLAGMLAQEGRCVEAIHWFDKLLKREPLYADAWIYKGNAHYERGEFELAKKCYVKVAELQPSGGAQVRLAAAIPMIPDSVEHIGSMRERFLSQLQALIDVGLTVQDPIRENGYTNFFLAYHGLDDLPLQRKYAALYEKACPSLLYEGSLRRKMVKFSVGEKIRIGFISKYLKGHSIGKTSYGIIKYLDRNQFEVVVIFLGPPSDQMGRAIASAADEVLVLPNELRSARQMIEKTQLDILFYQDIGMDPFTYFLAFARLAPVQCTSFGHPVTSGIKNMDYYISTELWEPEDADSHYSETLIRLSGVASVAYYLKPELPDEMKPRSYYRLPENVHLYICPQTLFKFHPDFDYLMADILRKDMDGLIVLIEGKHKPWADILRRRFARSVPDVIDRICFVPRQDGEDYMNLLRIADVMLDTVHFCGFNTTLEGFAAGLPVVTLPGRFMRSRHTAAFYRKMGYLECIANDEEHYVEIALRLGTDEVHRGKVMEEIDSRLNELWEEKEVIEGFEKFFKEAHQVAMARTKSGYIDS